MERLAGIAGLSLDEPSVISLIATLADGNPGRVKLLMDRLIMLSDKQTVSEQDARDLLSIPADSITRDAKIGGVLTDWNKLTGIEFERMITGLLKKMASWRK